MGRILDFLADVRKRLREEGLGSALHLVRTRLYSTTDTLLFEYRGTGEPYRLPEGWSLRAIRAEDDPALELLRRSGGDFTPECFRRGAVAYLVCIGEEPVAHRYVFPKSPLARRLGPGTTYFGNAFVRPEWRGRDINGHLLRAMAGLEPRGTRILLAVAHENGTNQRSLARNGAVLQGRLKTTVFLGRLVRARVEAAKGGQGRPAMGNSKA